MTIKEFVAKNNIRMSTEWAHSNPNMSDMPAGSSHWLCRFRKGNKQMTVPFSMGPAHSSEPEAADVLECLQSDASSADQDFENWASDLGYDADSRKADRIYRAVQKQTEKLRNFLNGSFDLFMEARD